MLQPILEQINDETEGLLLQDLKHRWFKISLCTDDEIEEQKRMEHGSDDERLNQSI